MAIARDECMRGFGISESQRVVVLGAGDGIGGGARIGAEDPSRRSAATNRSACATER